MTKEKVIEHEITYLHVAGERKTDLRLHLHACSVALLDLSRNARMKVLLCPLRLVVSSPPSHAMQALIMIICFWSALNQAWHFGSTVSLLHYRKMRYCYWMLERSQKSNLTLPWSRGTDKSSALPHSSMPAQQKVYKFGWKCYIRVCVLCVGKYSQGEKVHLVLLLIIDESGYGEHLQCVPKL